MSNKTTDAYQSWLTKSGVDLFEQSHEPNGELLRAEPDLVAAPEPKVPEELEAAIEAIQDGALKELSATQQQIFQMSIVEGMKDKEVMSALSLDKQAFKFHMKDIGFKLRKLTLKKLQSK